MSQDQKGISLLFYHAGYYEIACSIMGQLTASDVGALLASLRITPSQHTVERFLQPLRDFDHTMRLFEPWFQDNCQVLIIGPDTIRLSDRIFNANEYYKGKRPSQTQLEVWIFAIPANFEKSAKEVQCLRHCSHASSFSLQERAEARIAGEELLENSLVRQISHTELQPRKVSGEYLDVKVFDLFNTTTRRYLHTTHLIGLQFAGMEFGIEWNIKDPMSKDDCWKAKHGIPYIEAARPRDTKVAVQDRWRHRKPQSLVFNSQYPDWDPQSTVSIPISSS